MEFRPRLERWMVVWVLVIDGLCRENSFDKCQYEAKSKNTITNLTSGFAPARS
jgi:hypothetical protein